MAKNILIFSDGTGQIGGIRPDQRLSNIYKMYRAMRPWPDSEIDPAKQVAFYDPGLGAGEGRGLALPRLRNFLNSAFGTGISENIVDCYEAVIRVYQPGDRVFLFGFSRGAYTARCVANVLNLCGVPQVIAGKSLPRGGPSLRSIAEEAVYSVYEHGSGKNRGAYEGEREELARRFRARYGSAGLGVDGEAQGNVAPTFIGVFDTVAALGSVIVRRILGGILFISLALAVLAWWLGSAGWAAVALIPTALLMLATLGAVRRQFKYIRNPPQGGGLSWHFAAWNLKNYDRFLDSSVGWARHALSIDENRSRFPRVGWGSVGDVQRVTDRKIPWLDQVWFAGNHSDIGGSYAEEESRLSDVALGWMVSELRSIPEPPLLNDAMLNLFPDPLGPQHDEVASSRDTWLPRWVPKFARFGWSETSRSINPQAKLHEAVHERLAAPSVPQYDTTEPYRPIGLKGHESAQTYYLVAQE